MESGAVEHDVNTIKIYIDDVTNYKSKCIFTGYRYKMYNNAFLVPFSADVFIV